MKMLEIYLVTGFLGAGKTTFIKKFIRFLKSGGKRIAVIENEFGAANIDSAILEEETGGDIEELSGGCICCGLKVNFHDLLLNLAESGRYDCVIIEPSGIFNMDDFFEVALSPSLRDISEIASVITVFSPDNCGFTDEETEKIMYAELHSTGIVLISKSGGEQASVYAEAERYITRLFEKYSLPSETDDGKTGEIPEIVLKSWDKLTPGDFEKIKNSPPVFRNHKKNALAHSLLFNSYTIEPESEFSRESVKSALTRIMAGEFGFVYRIKGYVRGRGVFFEVNCADNQISVRESDSARSPRLNVIGKNFARRKIKDLFTQCASGYQPTDAAAFSE